MNDLDSSPAPLEGNETVPDLLSLVKQRIEDRLSARIDELGARVDALNARLDSGESAGSSASGDSDETLSRHIKTVMKQVFVDSGVLEALARRIVDRELESRRGGGEDGDALRRQAGKLVKEFLSQHLGTIFQTEIGPVVEDSIAKFLSGERIKELIDDKFRAVTLYMKTEVIPKAVEKVLSETTA